MSDVSTLRLYMLRVAYGFIAVGLAFMIWPGILRHSYDVPLMNTVVRSLLGAVALLSALGIRYPLKMLPVLLFELVWKSIWLIAFALPLWSADRLSPATMNTINECLVGVVLCTVAIPWSYVFVNYVRRSGERWKPVSA